MLRFDLVVLGRDQLEDALDRFGYSGAAADTGLGDGDLSSDDGAAAASGRPAGNLRMLEHRLRVHVSEVSGPPGEAGRSTHIALTPRRGRGVPLTPFVFH